MTMTVTRDLVPVEPLQQAFLRSGLSAREVAARLGWTRNLKGKPGRVPDSSRVLRYLGLRAWCQGGGRPSYTRTRISYPTAVALCRAINVDPGDVDL